MFYGKNSIVVGKAKDGQELLLPDSSRKLHTHIVGASGRGKSKFVEHLIRQDIINNKGLCLIDPHGYLYDDLVKWCTSMGFLDRGKASKNIILLDPSEPDWTFGFNPLKFDRDNLDYYVDEMVEATAKAFGEKDTNKTPTLKKLLTVIYYCLAEKQMSLAEGRYLIFNSHEEVRKHLTKKMNNPIVNDLWEEIRDYKSSEFRSEFLSSVNRISSFLRSNVMMNIVGQTGTTLDTKTVMDEGAILLVNLGSGGNHGRLITETNRIVLGTLLINDFLQKARHRERNGKPFYLYIDEAPIFLNENIERILVECRKFGLHLTLAHQTLAQLGKEDDPLYQGVMQGAQNKVIFGGLTSKECRVFADELFDFSIEKFKESSKNPMVVGHHREQVESYAKGRQTASATQWSETDMDSVGRGSGSGDTDGLSVLTGQTLNTPMDGGLSPGGSMGITQATTRQASSNRFLTENSSSGHASTKGGSEMEGESEQWGISEILVPDLEERYTQYETIEEQIYATSRVLKGQWTQEAVIKIAGDKKKYPACEVKTPTVKDRATKPEWDDKFKLKCYEKIEWVRPRNLVELEIKDRWYSLEQEAKTIHIGPPQPEIDGFIEVEAEEVHEEETESREVKDIKGFFDK